MNTSDVKNYLPEILLIRDEALQQKICDAWFEALGDGHWLERDPERACISRSVGAACPENLFAHTRHVAQLCDAAFHTMTPIFEHCGACDYDELIASALMHDVGKLIEFDFQNGENCYSSVGHLYKHPAVGAYYAKKHGMSDTIVHAVLTHSRTVSPENDKAFNTPVSLIMKHMDELAYFYVAMHYPKPKAE